MFKGIDMFKKKKVVGLVVYEPILLTTDLVDSITATYKQTIDGIESTHIYVSVSDIYVVVGFGDERAPQISDTPKFLELATEKVNITFEVLQAIVQDLLSVLRGEKDYLLGYHHTEFNASLNIHKDKPIKFPLSEIPRRRFTEEELLELKMV